MTQREMWRFGKNAIGFEDLLRRLEASHEKDQSYPPYNIVQLTDDEYRIEVAVAGFEDKDIEIMVESNMLTVKGEVVQEEGAEEVNYLHKGVSSKKFIREFTLGEHIQVEDAKMSNGMLHIGCKRVVPDAMKPRLINIS